VIELPARRPAALPFAAVGAACIVAGGLVAAVSAPAPSEHASWAAAYLVLVAGAARAALGVGQALLAPRVPSRRTIAVQFTAWNLGNGAVMAGTLAGITSLVDTGGALLVALLLLTKRRARQREAADLAAVGVPAPCRRPACQYPDRAGAGPNPTPGLSWVSARTRDVPRIGSGQAGRAGRRAGRLGGRGAGVGASERPVHRRTGDREQLLEFADGVPATRPPHAVPPGGLPGAR
jgi:hypothetical protein